MQVFRVICQSSFTSSRSFCVTSSGESPMSTFELLGEHVAPTRDFPNALRDGL